MVCLLNPLFYQCGPDMYAGIIQGSVSNGAQCVGRNAPGLIDRGAHLTVPIMYH